MIQSDDTAAIQNTIYSYFPGKQHSVYFSEFTSSSIISITQYFDLYNWLSGLISVAKELDTIRLAFNVSGCNATQSTLYTSLVSTINQLKYPYQVQGERNKLVINGVNLTDSITSGYNAYVSRNYTALGITVAQMV